MQSSNATKGSMLSGCGSIAEAAAKRIVVGILNLITAASIAIRPQPWKRK